ncbi:MAG: M23 family metallopeptidase [Thermoanaerobaculia bacterium]
MPRRLALAAILASLPLARAAAAAPPKQSQKPELSNASKADATLEEGRRLTQALYRNELSEIWKGLSPAAGSLVESPARLQLLRDSWLKKIGRETKILDEKTDSLAGSRRYLRIATFESSKKPMEVVWNFDRNDQISALGVGPRRTEAPSPHANEPPKVALRLPFDGEWTVWWGGRTLWTNFHSVRADQRFAADFFIVRDGRTFSGSGTKNEEFYAYGKSVFAPAAGTVVAVEGGRPDAVPGTVDRKANPQGNFVVLDLGQNVWAYFLHLKTGSIAVKPGQKVKAGEVLAQVGNSGRALEPSLHIHLQDAAEAGKGNGWPLVFAGVLRNGTPAASGEPVRGERFAPRP